jgi:hypothetical protein
MRPDGRTDVTKLIVAFRNFANAPKNVTAFSDVTLCSKIQRRQVSDEFCVLIEIVSERRHI